MVTCGSAGPKTCALPLMAATLIASGKHSFTNAPHLRDIRTMQTLLAHMGASSRHNHILRSIPRISRRSRPPTIWSKRCVHQRWCSAPCWPATGVRASPSGRVRNGASPSTCTSKPSRRWLDICPGTRLCPGARRRLRGAPISFGQVTVTGPENIMMAACLADGVTVLKNSALRTGGRCPCGLPEPDGCASRRRRYG